LLVKKGKSLFLGEKKESFYFGGGKKETVLPQSNPRYWQTGVFVDRVKGGKKKKHRGNKCS